VARHGGTILRGRLGVWRRLCSRSSPIHGSGFVDSLSRPGRNATGFMQFEYGLSAKWLDLLKQIVPGLARAAVLRDSATTAGIGQFAVIQYVASSVGVEVSPINLRDATEIERGVDAFARSSNGRGLIVTAGGSGSSWSSISRPPTRADGGVRGRVAAKGILMRTFSSRLRACAQATTFYRNWLRKLRNPRPSSSSWARKG
jgi:hypothetical protein